MSGLRWWWYRSKPRYLKRRALAKKRAVEMAKFWPGEAEPRA